MNVFIVGVEIEHLEFTDAIFVQLVDVVREEGVEMFQVEIKFG